MKSHCKRGHLRSPENVNSSRTCKLCDNERSARRRKDNPEAHRARNLGLDVEFVINYLLERGDVTVCDICQQECSSGRSLAIDHNHETNEIRGLLCGNCNRGLGNFQDSVKLLEKAVEYLTRRK